MKQKTRIAAELFLGCCLLVVVLWIRHWYFVGRHIPPTVEPFEPIPVTKMVDEGYSISAPLTTDQIEKEALAAWEKAGSIGHRPMMRSGNETWEEFKASLKVGDHLVLMSSPPETWRKLAGLEGYAIIRNGKIVAWVTTAMNG